MVTFKAGFTFCIIGLMVQFSGLILSPPVLEKERGL